MANDRPKGRCIGCLTADYPYCGGCGADLTDEPYPAAQKIEAIIGEFTPLDRVASEEPMMEDEDA